MIGTLDELLVVSDIDNTLLNAVEGLPEVNRATIQLFSSLGGRFTVATGRTLESVRRYLGDVAISAPVIALGGAVIYDFAKEQYIQNITLNKEAALAALREVQQNFPGVGIEVMTADGAVNVVQANEFTHMHTVQERLIYLLCPLADIRQEWNKVLFAGPRNKCVQLPLGLLKQNIRTSISFRRTTCISKLCRRGLRRETR